MGTFEGLYLWLMEWMLRKEQADQSWRRLAKGTKVSLVSTACLKGLAEQAKEAVRTGTELRDFDIDNSDILESGSLKLGLEAGVHYEPIPTSLYDSVFPATVHSSSNVPKGWVVWNGLFSPQIFLEGFRISVIVAKDKRVSSERLEILAGETLRTFLAKYEKKWVATDEETRQSGNWWTCTSAIDPDSFQSELLLQRPEDMETMQPLTRPDFPLFTQLSSLILFGDYRTSVGFPILRKWGYAQGMGLKNLGKTCFLNSALQSLIHLSQVVVTHIGQSPAELGRMAQLLIELLKRRYDSRLGPGMVYKPEEIYSLLPSVHKYGEKRDEDASELFLVLLELLHLSHPQPSPPPLPEDLPSSEHYAWLTFLRSESSLRAQVFSGLLRNKLQCCNCPQVSDRFAPFSVLPLDLPPCKTFHVSVVRQEVNQPQEAVMYQSETALEENEILNNVRDKVMSYTGLSEVIVGENRGKLLDSGIGLSNLVASNQFIALEIPQLQAEECAILVDIWLQERPLGTRILKVRRKTQLRALGEEVTSYLIALEQYLESQGLLIAYLPTWLPSLSNPMERTQVAYRDMLLGHSVAICALDGSGKFANIDSYESQGMQTIGEICSNGSEKMPRIRFSSPNIGVNVQNALKCLEPEKSLWASLVGERTDSDLWVTLPQLLDYTLREKPMNEEDAVSCSQCHCRTQRIATTQIARLPQVLVIVLQRVRYLPTGLQKSHIRIHYPLTGLDLTRFEQGSIRYPAFYDLQAVICHEGNSLTRGHYTAYVLSPVTDTWLKCDDENVRKVKDVTDVIKEEGAYMLFYARKN